MSPARRRRRRRLVVLGAFGAVVAGISVVRRTVMDANEARFRARYDRPS